LNSASWSAERTALLAGALFNLANILLVAAIDTAGMSVAFPVGIGLALVIGTAESYVQEQKGNVVLLGAGICLSLVAMIVSAVAHARLPGEHESRKGSGLAFAIVAGLLMGLWVR
jgi:glucose uptake protein